MSYNKINYLEREIRQYQETFDKIYELVGSPDKPPDKAVYGKFRSLSMVPQHLSCGEKKESIIKYLEERTLSDDLWKRIYYDVRYVKTKKEKEILDDAQKKDQKHRREILKTLKKWVIDKGD